MAKHKPSMREDCQHQHRTGVQANRLERDSNGTETTPKRRLATDLHECREANLRPNTCTNHMNQTWLCSRQLPYLGITSS